MTFMIGYGSVAKTLKECAMCCVRPRIRLFAMRSLKIIRNLKSKQMKQKMWQKHCVLRKLPNWIILDGQFIF